MNAPTQPVNNAGQAIQVFNLHRRGMTGVNSKTNPAPGPADWKVGVEQLDSQVVSVWPNEQKWKERKAVRPESRA
jgi:hypothetical protein